MPEITVKRIADGGDPLRLSAVFVHGLGGDPEVTWRHDNGFFWPHELAGDLKGLAVYTVGYPADRASWGSGWPIAQAAVALLDRLISDRALRASKTPIVFICHSLGGLIFKKLILTAQSDRGQDPRKAAFLDRIVGAVFLATPHGGSFMATIASQFHWFVSDSMRDLQANDANLADFSISYRNCIADNGGRVHHHVYYETEGIWGSKAVTETSADPGITGVRPVGIGRNHIAICKAPDRDDPVYEGVLAFLEDCTLAPRSPAPGEIRDSGPRATDPLPVVEADKSDQSSASDISKTIGYPVMAALGTLVSWLTAGQSAALGPALTALLSILGGISALAFSLIYGRYFGILGAGGAPEGSSERETYVRLRTSLAKGGIAARLYAGRLTRFIDAVDRFFGDAGMASRSLFPHAFGLKKPAPLWTPRAFDRCLFLALVYPIATIFIVWVLTGHEGPAEVALGLAKDLPAGKRFLIAARVVFQGFIIWSFIRRETLKSVVWIYAAAAIDTRAAAGIDAVIAAGFVAGAAVLTVLLGSAGAGALSFGVAVVAMVASAGRVAGAVAVAVAVPAAFGLAFGLGGASWSIVAMVTAIAAASSLGVLVLCAIAIRLGAQGVFLLLFIPAATVACLAAVGPLRLLTTWPHIGPLLLFQGLLTLINAPFNWASIGMTRALLRRGLELGGMWPYFLALADAILAALIVGLLALTMVITVQTFNDLATQGDGAPFMPLDQLLDGFGQNPAAPKYWWIYALLLASMIPSLINLMIGGASLISGAPGLPSLILRFLPEARAVPAFDRTWLAVALTLQTVVGAILGITAGALLIVVLGVYVMPDAGLGLLVQARALADYDLPARLGQYFASFR